MDKLLEQINQAVMLTRAEQQCVETAFHAQVLAKGEAWSREGTVCDRVAFVETGTLRVHYYDESGEEVTCYFVTPGRLISSYTSFLTNTPAQETISAIEKSRLWVIAKPDLEQLSADIPALQIWRRVIAENLFIEMEQRVSQLQGKTAGERYELMIREKPDILLSVPLQYTASFIGITPQHLSRLRKETSR